MSRQSPILLHGMLHKAPLRLQHKRRYRVCRKWSIREDEHHPPQQHDPHAQARAAPVQEHRAARLSLDFPAHGRHDSGRREGPGNLAIHDRGLGGQARGRYSGRGANVRGRPLARRKARDALSLLRQGGAASGAGADAARRCLCREGEAGQDRQNRGGGRAGHGRAAEDHRHPRAGAVLADRREGPGARTRVRSGAGRTRARRPSPTS